MADHEVNQDIPVFLLKTRNAPHDNYEDWFRNAPEPFAPVFIPVLEHRFRSATLKSIHQSIIDGSFAIGTRRYGGLIFTSQRAVEAFAEVVEGVKEQLRKDSEEENLTRYLPSDLMFYVVGPATARGLRGLGLQPQVLGEESGNGEALAKFMLADYNQRYASSNHGSDQSKPGLLFLVGEQRRDIIPNNLQSKDIDPSVRIEVEELVVYETAELESFQADFSQVWRSNTARHVPVQWVVVFSPQGCRHMLFTLGAIGDASGAKGQVGITSTKNSGITKTYIVTIGPTTRDFLQREFNIQPDVCAEKPSPEGVGLAITSFMKTISNSAG